MMRLIALLSILTAAAVLLRVVAPGEGVHGYLLIIVAVVAFAVAARTSLRFGRIDRVQGRTGLAVGSLPRFLERADRRLETASVSVAQFEPLRRQLRAIAEQRLARHGCRLGSERARQLLGQESSLLLERAPDDRFAPGPRRDELDYLLDALERL